MTQKLFQHYRKTLLGLLFSLMAMSGCVYTNIKQPLDTDVATTTLGTKVGTAQNESVLWMVAWGDGGTAAAARNGGIRTINHMDQEVFLILFGLYTRTTTIVYGD